MKLAPGDANRHNHIEYPMEVGAPKFELVPIEKQKDVMLNAARLHAQQEYDRIMEVVKVLQDQANRIKWRLEVTDQIHAAEYEFQVAHGNVYWLAKDLRRGKVILTITGPDDWSSGKPEHYEYITRVKWLGDYTWIEVNEDGEPTKNN